ncbi:MAG: hypothetical protein H7X83_05530 [Verrucomicrobia bacterium]|nr:hypothetical protein [Deltaproteobacteria bacterium]
MKDNNPIDTDRRYTLLTCLLLPALLCLAGCSATLPSVTLDSMVSCSTVPEKAPSQNAPDDCRKEICVEGRLKSIEDLTETAPVSGWAEEAFCFFHPLDCFGALSVKKHVRQWELDKANAGLWDHASLQSGLGDAARHAYLGCTLAERFGGVFAKGLLDAHEEDSSVMFGFGTGTGGNKCCDKLMDLHNNRIGTKLAHQSGSCEEKVLQSLHRLRHSLCVK